MKVEDFFAPAGPLARTFDGYRRRPGQVELARAVERTIEIGCVRPSVDEVLEEVARAAEVLIAEAPVGTGKSQGYLVPAVLSGKRTIVVTANLALQDQLAKKDLPALERALGRPLKWEVLKGMSNYLCQLGYSRALREPPYDPDRQLAELASWARRTKTGDLSELAFELQPALKRALTVSSEECSGKKCPKKETCHVYEARDRAASAQVIVTNYHLLFADLAVRAATDDYAKLLPDADVLILDEGHRAADIARDCSGFRVTAYMVNWISRHVGGGRRGGGPDPALAQQIDAMNERFFSNLTVQCGHGYLEDVRDPGSEDLCALLDRAAEVLETARGGSEEVQAQRESAARRAGELSRQIAGFFSRTLDGWAYWAEKEGRFAALRASPLDVSGVFAELFSNYGAVVVTSATLRDGQDFALVERELGIDRSGARLSVESPFDFSTSMLVCPEEFVDAGTPRYPEACARLLGETVKKAGGKTLGLFTSYAALDVAHKHLLGLRLPFRILRQGEAPRGELLRIFSEDVNSVLLGTDSFWEGVDVPGRALSVVFIDKLPFPRPDDPVVSRLIKADKRKGYSTHAIGRAVRKFRQGFGRLVRRDGDFGLIVCPDTRLFEANFSSRFLRGLPAALDLCRDMNEVDWSQIAA